MPLGKKIGAIALSLTVLFGAGGVGAMQQDAYDRISGDMESLRELVLLEPLNIAQQDRTELQEYLLQSIAEEYPEEEQERDLRIMVLFGLAEEGTDLGTVQTDLLGEQVAGYYDPETKEMVVVTSNTSGELSASDEVTFAHEVVHALQDQTFDLMSIHGNEDMPDDQSLAITALIEGDATVAQVQYMVENPGLLLRLQGELEDLDMSVLDSAPRFLSETLYFPYEGGADFVTALYDVGGWELVNDAYSNLPQSTEQVLHPEKYLAGEAPVAVDAFDPLPVLGPEWEVLDVNTFGELIIDIVLDSGHVRPSDAEAAAAGWGGDEYVVAATDEDIVLVWATEWDTEEDAQEFFTVLTAHERNRFSVSGGPAEGRQYRFQGDGLTGDIVLDGTSVTYVLSSDESLVDPLVANQRDGTEPAATPAT